ncbi:hypothetical protein ACFL6G_08660 [candidate division KSB1 bacterium]
MFRKNIKTVFILMCFVLLMFGVSNLQAIDCDEEIEEEGKLNNEICFAPTSETPNCCRPYGPPEK